MANTSTFITRRNRNLERFLDNMQEHRDRQYAKSDADFELEVTLLQMMNDLGISDPSFSLDY